MTAFIIMAIIGGTISFFAYYTSRGENQNEKSPPEPPSIPKIQMTPEELTSLLCHYGTSDETFSIPCEYLPLHESFYKLIQEYDKISFNPYYDVFDRTLMKTPFSDNPIFIPINESDGDVFLIRMKSNDPNVYIAMFHDDMSKPVVHTTSLHDYLLIEWETEIDSWREICAKKNWQKKYPRLYLWLQEDSFLSQALKDSKIISNYDQT